MVGAHYIKMKIAIFHNFLDNMGGAEIVTLTLARELNADVYTTNIDKEKIKKMGFQIKNIYSIGKIPKNPPFKHQLASKKFLKLNLRNRYDFFIISGDWALSSSVNNKPNLWYIHSPKNEIWQFYEYVRKNNVPWILRPLYDLWVIYNRELDRKHIKHVNKLVCNSKNTQARVKKFFNAYPIIINPPIETKNYKYKKPKNYWLSVNRLSPPKRIEMQIKAFQKLPNERLIIVGSYEKNSRVFEKYKRYLEKIKSPNVKIINWIDKKQLIKLYSNCKGFITTTKNEDFGMTPIEAMASGKPVIAPNEGGYKESIINNKTGILIDDVNPDKIIEAINTINKSPIRYRNACQKQAKKFDIKNFIKKIKQQIKNDD